MNKVYSCAFLSALDKKNTSWLLYHVHVLSSGDQISSSTHGTALLLVWGSNEEKKIQAGETDRGRGWVFVCWRTCVLSATGCYKNWPGPLLLTSALAPDWAETGLSLFWWRPRPGCLSPCMCLHRLLWLPQLITHNTSASLGKIIDHVDWFCYLSS